MEAERRMQAASEDMSKLEKANKVARYRRLNAYARKGQIVFAGSSLMEQFPVAEFLMDFEVPLAIYNRGVGGFVCAELRGALEDCILALAPSRIFLNIGTNDLNDPACDDAALIGRYEPIVREIVRRLPGAELILLAYYPVNPDVEDNPHIADMLAARTNERIRDANVAVRDMARRLGVRFLDVNAGLYDAQGRLKREYTIEGMHMHPEGYEAVWRALLPVLLERRA